MFPVKRPTLSRLARERSSHTNKLVAELYWPEEPCIFEMHKAADYEMAQLDGHVPEMVWFHKFEETSSASIRKALRIDPTERGSRVLYIIVFK